LIAGAFPAQVGHALAAQAKRPAVRGARRDRHHDPPAERRHLDLAAERGGPHRHLDLALQVVIDPCEHRAPGALHGQVEIAAAAPPAPKRPSPNPPPPRPPKSDLKKSLNWPRSSGAP